jgi:hypothetical protein
MREFILDQISSALAARNVFFLREQDIQLYLAYYFLRSNLYDNVFIEYHVPRALVPPYLWSDANNIYIDIVLQKNDEFYPIEIKYKTMGQSVPHLVFGQNVNVLLGHQGAQNIGCYDFWKDIKRIEFFESAFELAKRGIVLFISNDISYRTAPLNPNTGYAQFSLHQGRHIPAGTQLNWNGHLTVANGRPGITVNYEYNINWTQLPYHEQHHFILT